jgi:hypothetical protein
MPELIKRPSVTVTRKLVETALLRLVRYPGTTSVRNVMRVVDEYAATLFTDKVYKHADRLVGEALVDAAQAERSGKKISVEVNVDGVSPDYVKKFLTENFCTHEKKFLSDLVHGAESVVIMVEPDDLGTSPGTDRVRNDLGTKSGTNRVPTATHPSGKDTLATPAGGAVTPATDTRDTVTDATDTRDTVPLSGDTVAPVTAVTDKGGLATDCPDTADSPEMIRVPTSDAQPVPSADPAPKVDMATYESGKSEPDAPALDAPADRLTGAPDAVAEELADVKTCTQCNRSLALSCYGRNRSRPDGRASACGECEARRNRERREAKRQSAAQGGQKRPSGRL